jgi:DNA helicase-2/ATP-dependent DNA helicase PcrA
LEEERRLCYVGITRAQEILYLTHARERRLYGSREPAIASQFLGELPKDLLSFHFPSQTKVAATTSQPTQRWSHPNNSTPSSSDADRDWQVGDRIFHKNFGIGEVTHIFGSGNKISLAVRFASLGTPKIVNPKIDPLQKVE